MKCGFIKIERGYSILVILQLEVFSSIILASMLHGINNRIKKLIYVIG